MSASWDRSKFDEPSLLRAPGHRQQSLTPPSRPSTSSRPSTGKVSPTSARSTYTAKSGKDLHGHLATPNSTDRDTGRTSLKMSSDTHTRDSNDELSSNAHGSPEAQLVAGAPGVARRAKAHVPSACVNCKKKHLACETKRPCNRCIHTGKESSCIDVQHKKRGRPRLREEDHNRDIAFGGDYTPGDFYPDPNGALAEQQSSQRRSKTYRELRSQPESSYGSQRPRTSDPTYSQQHYGTGNAAYPLSPTANAYFHESIPTVLLTTEFVVAQHNRAFSEALSLPLALRGRTLLDLVVPAEREKIQRLQSAMRTELREATHTSHMRSGPSSRASMPVIEHLDIAHATAGFRTRSEYWTFRLSGHHTRGFPISISLAKDGAYFVVLTLVQGATSLQGIQSPPMHQLVLSTPGLPSSTLRSVQSPPQQALPFHVHNRGGSNDLAHPYLLPSNSPAYDEQMLQLQPSLGLAQYKHASPPQHPLPYNPARTDSGSSGGLSVARSSLHEVTSRNSLKHLQLPPIRTAPTSDPSGGKDSGRRRHPTETPSPSRTSPHSATSMKRKKRRRVDIEGLLR
ncbi:hypothetical protein MMC21_003537 [Puttea exsequens]|nr:hypothetical protein [Puttea exsequens]